MNPGAPRCAPEPNLPNLNLDVQVRVRLLAALNQNVQVQVRKKLHEPEPNWTATSLAADASKVSYNFRNASSRRKARTLALAKL